MCYNRAQTKEKQHEKFVDNKEHHHCRSGCGSDHHWLPADQAVKGPSASGQASSDGTGGTGCQASRTGQEVTHT